MIEFKEATSSKLPNFSIKSLNNSNHIEKTIEKFRQTKINSLLPSIYRQKKIERHLWTNGKIGIVVKKPSVQIKIIEKLPKIQYLSNTDDAFQSTADGKNTRKSRKNSIDYQDRLLCLKLSNENIEAEERALRKSNNDSFCRYKIEGLKIKVSSFLESIPESEYHNFTQTDLPFKVDIIDWRQPWSSNLMAITPKSSKPSSLPTISE